MGTPSTVCFGEEGEVGEAVGWGAGRDGCWPVARKIVQFVCGTYVIGPLVNGSSARVRCIAVRGLRMTWKIDMRAAQHGVHGVGGAEGEVWLGREKTSSEDVGEVESQVG